MKEDIVQTIRAVLSDIGNSMPLKDHEADAHALHDLLVAYQTLAASRQYLPVLTRESTGDELKDAIAQLEPSQAMVLLARYVAGKRDAHENEQSGHGTAMSPEVANLQMQIYILAIILAVFIALTIAGAIYAVLVHLGLVTPGAVLREVGSLLKDALKMLWGID
jgi:hypothetical protein